MENLRINFYELREKQLYHCGVRVILGKARRSDLQGLFLRIGFWRLTRFGQQIVFIFSRLVHRNTANSIGWIVCFPKIWASILFDSKTKKSFNTWVIVLTTVNLLHNSRYSFLTFHVCFRSERNLLKKLLNLLTSLGGIFLWKKWQCIYTNTGNT